MSKFIVKEKTVYLCSLCNDEWDTEEQILNHYKECNKRKKCSHEKIKLTWDTMDGDEVGIQTIYIDTTCTKCGKMFEPVYVGDTYGKVNIVALKKVLEITENE
jgi:DNA-directed RNA polymerase subunit RPC12/RpoP